MTTQIISGLAVLALILVGWRVYQAARVRQEYSKEEQRQAAIVQEEKRLELARQQAIIDFHRIRTQGLQVAIMQGADYKVHHDGMVEVKYPLVPTSHVAQLPPPALPAALLALPLAPAFRQIAHLIAPGHLILGYGAQGAIYGDVTDLLSTAIVGRPGTGKTTMLRLVCAQILQIEGLPLLLDPHGSIVDELGDVINCAETGAEISDLTVWLEGELEARLVERRQGLPQKQPILLLADEWPIISQLSPDALQPVRRIVLEGRKVGIYALICGQGLPAQLLGGTLVRDALASRYVFNTTAQQARLAGLDNDTAKTMLARLEGDTKGIAILASSKRRPELVAIPFIETHDVRRIVEGTLTGTGNTQERRSPPAEPFPLFPFPTEEHPGTAKIPFEEREQIIALRNQGVPRREICAQLGRGKAYYETVKTVLDEYEQVREEA